VHESRELIQLLKCDVWQCDVFQKLHHLRLAAVAGGVKDDVGSGFGSLGGGNGPLANYLSGWMWRIGLFLVFFGSLADFAALSFGPQSLVAPLGSLTLVSNVLFAPLLLRETIGRWDVLATALIVTGSSVAVLFGSHDAATFTVFQLFGFFARWDFVLYALVVGLYSGLLYMSIQKIERIETEEGVHAPRYMHYRALHRFAYPALSGTVGAQSVLFAKVSDRSQQRSAEELRCQRQCCSCVFIVAWRACSVGSVSSNCSRTPLATGTGATMSCLPLTTAEVAGSMGPIPPRMAPSCRQFPCSTRWRPV
jgi:hypothetical protein